MCLPQISCGKGVLEGIFFAIRPASQPANVRFCIGLPNATAEKGPGAGKADSRAVVSIE